MTQNNAQLAYWRTCLRMTGLLLLVWLVVTVVSSWYAAELNQIVMLGFPLGFYMGAQGSLLVYLLIIWFYGSRMQKLDEEYGVEEQEND